MWPSRIGGCKSYHHDFHSFFLLMIQHSYHVKVTIMILTVFFFLSMIQHSFDVKVTIMVLTVLFPTHDPTHLPSESYHHGSYSFSPTMIHHIYLVKVTIVVLTVFILPMIQHSYHFKVTIM